MNLSSKDNNKFNNKKKNKDPNALYYILAIFLVFTISYFTIPKINRGMDIKQSDYVSFVNMVNEGKVKTVEVRDKTIAFEVVKKDGKTEKYETSVFFDPSLVDRLIAHNVKSSQIYPKEINPIMQLLLSLLSTLFFIGLLWFIFSKFILLSPCKKSGFSRAK